MVDGCPACRTERYVANLEVTYDFEAIASRLTAGMLAARPATMWRYAELLPIGSEADAVSLGEGMTSLIVLPELGAQLGVPGLYLKNESTNPTWSFKDRLCSVAVSAAVQFKANGIVASSTGNHGASAAAYAARARLPCVVLTLDSVPDTAKIQIQAYGARVIATHASADRWVLMRYLVDRGWYGLTNFAAPAVGSNPFGVEGHKTIAFEIAEQLGWQAPDFVIMPVGYADGLAGVWKGFTELHQLGWISNRPKMIAAEVHGPLANALEKGLDYVAAVEVPYESVAYSIGGPVSATQGLRAVQASGGQALRVADAAILEMQLKLAATEGIYLEPASASAVAALRKLAIAGVIGPGHRVVIVGTSSGLKDPAATRANLPALPVIAPDPAALRRALRESYGFELLD
jgi:threonine synthase